MLKVYRQRRIKVSQTAVANGILATSTPRGGRISNFCCAIKCLELEDAVVKEMTEFM
jgi:hypothetical protein